MRLQTTAWMLLAANLAGMLSAAPIDTAVIPGPISFTVGDTALSSGFPFPVNPPYGVSSTLPNHVYAISQASGLNSDPVYDLYRSGLAGPPDGTNVSIAGTAGITYRLRSSGSLGLLPGDKMSAISYGTDGTGPSPTGLLFTVDPDALGAPGTAVRLEATADRAAGGIFGSTTFAPFGIYQGAPVLDAALSAPSANVQVAAPEDFGLAVGKPIPKDSRPGQFEDDLDGLAARETALLYFVLDPFSSSVGAGIGSADLLVSTADGPFSVFRSHETMGLQAEDVIDALALSIPANVALFSLAPDSPSLLAGAFSPADVFITGFDEQFAFYAGHASLGLRVNDNLNGLDVYTVPEPGTFIIAGVSLILLVVRRSRTLIGR